MENYRLLFLSAHSRAPAIIQTKIEALAHYVAPTFSIGHVTLPIYLLICSYMGNVSKNMGTIGEPYFPNAF
jgi:hypothetical protein